MRWIRPGVFPVMLVITLVVVLLTSAPEDLHGDIAAVIVAATSFLAGRASKELRMLRPCEVWMSPVDENARRIHQQSYGHAVHECIIERPFAQDHPGDHRCKCGITWPHAASDNDPAPKPDYDLVNVWIETIERQPPKEGYYLAAWNRHGKWIVSELWYNPAGIGPGWWTARRYLHEPGRTLISNDVDVAAWMYMPEYTPPGG